MYARHLLVKCLLLGMCLLGPAAARTDTQQDINQLPDLGDESAAVVSPQQERKLGENSLRQARRYLVILDDPELTEYLQTLGNKLVAASGAQQPFRFFLVNDPTLNAFAVPGGFIGVHTGLLLAAQNEGELAGVLAHEIAHITQRHIPRMIAQNKRMSGPALAALIAGLVVAGSNPQVGEAALVMTMGGLAQNQLNFSRAFEQEADRLGIAVLAAAGYNPRAMPAFFERMQQWARLNDSNLPEFLRTHPITGSRIAEAQDRAERYAVRSFTDGVDFYRAQAKLRALSPGNVGDIMTGFKQSLEPGKHRHPDVQRYGYALALSRAEQFDQARGEIARLIEREPANISYRLAQADIELAAGNRSRALQLYEAARKMHPHSKALGQRYASALLEAGQPRPAMAVLKDLLRQTSDEPALYKMLGRAAGESGALVEAHQATAEYYYLTGDTRAALEQLRIALRHAGNNFYYRSSLEARSKEIQEEAALWAVPADKGPPPP